MRRFTIEMSAENSGSLYIKQIAYSWVDFQLHFAGLLSSLELTFWIKS